MWISWWLTQFRTYLIEQGHYTSLVSVSVYFGSSFYYCCWDRIPDFQRIYKSNYFHHQFLKSSLFWNMPPRWVCCLEANMLNKSIFRNVKDGWNKKTHILCIQIYVHILYHLQGFPLQSDQRLLNKATQVPRELSALSLKDDIVSHDIKAELGRKKTKM